MNDIKEMRTHVAKVKSEEVKAFNIMAREEETTKTQQKQIKICLQYRDQCLADLIVAKTSGLSINQVRECHLLAEHLNSVVKAERHRVDLSKEKFSQAEKEWKRKNEHYKKLKKNLEQLEIEYREKSVR